MEEMVAYALITSKYVLIILSLAIIMRCIRSMLSEKYEPETWAYLKVGSSKIPVHHWENLIGSSKSADIRIERPFIRKTHAVLTRSDKGVWKIQGVFGRSGVSVDGRKIPANGAVLQSGDQFELGNTPVTFLDITTKQLKANESRRTNAGKSVSPSVTLLELTVVQIFLVVQHMLSCKDEDLPLIALAFATLIVIEWCCFTAMKIIDRSGYEIETLAFYLTTLGLSVVASSTPEDLYKQVLLIIASVVIFLFSGAWLRNLARTKAVRIPVAAFALLLMAVNVVTSEEVMGARNWLTFGGYSFQPSELVKFAFIYAGSSTLDRLYHRRNLYGFIVFSAACVVSLALIGDFGTALIFFTSFLVMSFMRSGSIATVFLAVSGAGLAGFLAVSVKPYIARRFATWGHVWEDVYNAGYQQTRAMSAAASGGLFGKGAGAGWLKTIVAANTDMVFAVVCEELGLIIAFCSVLAVLTLAFFAVRSASHARSSFYSLAACTAMSMLLVQMSLNVFGSLDILPYTGVTFPFVSKGGTSLLSCWLLMSFIKSADNRRGASFAVRSIKKGNDGEEATR